MKKYPTILAIDTSCDETSVAVTQGMRMLSNAVASQIEIHRKYGGVMPLEAKLAHHEKINPTYLEALKRAGVKPSELDAIAVTVGPGLAIALEVGIEFAKSLSKELNKPLIAVNHMAGHLYSCLAVNSKGNPDPKIAINLENLNAQLIPNDEFRIPNNELNLKTNIQNIKKEDKKKQPFSRLTNEHLDFSQASNLKHNSLDELSFWTGAHSQPDPESRFSKNSGYWMPCLPAGRLRGYPQLQHDNANQSSGYLIKSQDIYPILGLLISGKHTEIIGIQLNQKSRIQNSRPSPNEIQNLKNPINKLKNNSQFSNLKSQLTLNPIKLGQTVDDAAGECLDKFARMLDLGYPGAHVMEQLARAGNSKRFNFPLPMTQSHDLNYSFSGLKTAGRHQLEKMTNDQLSMINEKANPKSKIRNEIQQTETNQPSNHLTLEQLMPELPTTHYQLQATDISDLAASFQAAVIRAILYKLRKAIEMYQPQQLWVGGGVTANLELRKQLRHLAKKYQLTLRLPFTKRLMGDNAGMIGVAAYFQYLNQDFITNIDALHRQPRLSL